MSLSPNTSLYALNKKRLRAERTPPSLKIEGLRLTVESVPFDLTLTKGEILTAFGTTPFVLSTFLEQLAGFAPLIDGKIFLHDEDVSSLPLGKRKIGLINQHTPLFPHMNVHENIAFAFQATGQNKSEAFDAANRMLSLVGLDGHGHAHTKSLSSEETLRTLLARALACSPKLLLIDDPYFSLPLHTTRQFTSLLIKLSRALDLTIVQTTSHREDALRAGGKIAFFNHEALLQHDTAAVLYDRPAAIEIATIFGEANALTGQILGIGDDIASIQLACGGVVEAFVSSERLHKGDECIVCIRPDQISPFFGSRPLNFDEDTSSPVNGVLIESIHLGDHIKMRVRTPDGTEIDLHRPPIQSQQIPSNGSSVQLAWMAGNATAFPP
ncbi:ABC transporter ATP-binding protein [Swingsia samuiensis]|uniref:ABC transporter ATP-binding protein n=1 Tax=Swingsia samuiensis TaxID=1293412 RepID=A0A4Y6UL92_9PROT|nr:ABC transporter ATP-binding protein [Swingsia samuiensis]QDH17161.1 ABC transporter ATP-binding protein [Swingsia samuiensis]